MPHVLRRPYVCSRYKRVFSVGSHGITTYNPTTLEVTNQVCEQLVLYKTFLHSGLKLVHVLVFKEIANRLLGCIQN